MRTALFIMITTSILATAFPQQKKPAGVNVRVTIKGLRNKHGQLLAALFTAPKGFPSGNKHAHQSVITSITNTPLQIVFTNVPAGTCAIGISHDENKNGKMDTRSFGRPKEGYGVSGTPAKRVGAPRFKDCAFQVTNTNMNLVVTVAYPET